MELDSEQIIVQVEMYPVLYNTGDENYKNRIAKVEAWKKVTEAVVGEGYKEMEFAEQNRIGKEVQMKWKTIKDAYIRSLKTQTGKSGSGANKRRPYIYHHQMSFLQPILQNRQTSGNMELLPESQEKEPEPRPTVPAVRPKDARSLVEKKRGSFESQLINILQTSIPKPQERTAPLPPESDADKMFLLSLLPKLKQLNQTAAFDFQIKVMQLLQQYLADKANTENSGRSTSSMQEERVLLGQKNSQTQHETPSTNMSDVAFHMPSSSNTSSSYLSPQSVLSVEDSEESVLSFLDL